MGSLQGRGWNDLPLLLATLLPGLCCIACCWRALDVLGLGDEQAAQAGLAVGRARLLLLLGASSMTAGCVAVAGVIGFVGLVARMCCGCDSGSDTGRCCSAHFSRRFAAPLGRCGGALAARRGMEIPVGVVTALIGGPFFAFLVKRR